MSEFELFVTVFVAAFCAYCFGLVRGHMLGWNEACRECQRYHRQEIDRMTAELEEVAGELERKLGAARATADRKGGSDGV